MPRGIYSVCIWPYSLIMSVFLVPWVMAWGWGIFINYKTGEDKEEKEPRPDPIQDAETNTSVT